MIFWSLFNLTSIDLSLISFFYQIRDYRALIKFNLSQAASQDILVLINSIIIRYSRSSQSESDVSKTRDIKRSKFIELLIFSENWMIDKFQLLSNIKKFYNNCIEYRIFFEYLNLKNQIHDDITNISSKNFSDFVELIFDKFFLNSQLLRASKFERFVSIDSLKFIKFANLDMSRSTISDSSNQSASFNEEISWSIFRKEWKTMLKLMQIMQAALQATTATINIRESRKSEGATSNSSNGNTRWNAGELGFFDHYHVMNDNLANSLMYSARKSIQSIMFLSRLLNSAETRYWSTELKLTGLIWILRKIRHLMNFANKSSIIYIDHEISLAIVKQISLFTSSTDKLNLRLVRASDYIQRFDLIIRHKSDKLHLVSDALSRLSIIAAFTKDHSLNEKFDVLFTVSLMKMISEFKKKLIKEYFMNSIWIKIDKLITTFNRDDTNLFFVKINELIYRKNSHNMFFISQRLCISKSFVKNILHIAHDVNHTDFDRTYLNVISFYYIKSLFTKVNQYLKHCSKCVVNQTKRHKSYDSLQSIFSSSISFHTITIDFVLVMSSFHIDINNVMTTICKFFKRATIISDRDTWTAFQWAVTLLHRLNIANWELSKIIIFDKNKKFLFELWNKLFQKLKIDYFISRHITLKRTKSLKEKIKRSKSRCDFIYKI